jgi:hypothetical protein
MFVDYRAQTIRPPLNDKKTVEWLKRTKNVLLIRHPKHVLLSWLKTSGVCC